MPQLTLQQLIDKLQQLKAKNPYVANREVGAARDDITSYQDTTVVDVTVDALDRGEAPYHQMQMTYEEACEIKTEVHKVHGSSK